MPNYCATCLHIRKPPVPSYSKNPLPEIYLCAKHGKHVESNAEKFCYVPWTEAWLTAYCVGCTVWMQNSSIRDFRERLECNGKTVSRIVRGFQRELT